LKKIFISTPWFFPAFKAGGPVQSIANMVQHLNEGYEFYIYTSDTDLDEAPLRGIKQGQWERYNAYTSVWYAPKENRSNSLLKQVELTKPDVLYMVGVYSWYFTQVPILFSRVPVKLLSVRGMLHPGALAEKRWKKKIYLQVARWLRLPGRVLFHATDATERAYIEKALGTGLRQYEAGNFPRLLQPLQLPVKQAGSLKLVSVALLSPMKHILGVLHALSLCEGDIQYDIYGPVKDQLYMNDCRQAARKLPGHVQVKFHGEVSPFFVPEVLAKAQVFILPSRSENFGHSIVEALSAAMPVITSHHTPWNGLELARAGINADDTDKSLAKAIDFFAAMDAGKMETWQRGAREYVTGRVAIDPVKEQYRKMNHAG
jgi:glycosyltransferase involved in cell wall biosynthesis